VLPNGGVAEGERGFEAIPITMIEEDADSWIRSDARY
jgi:hypothetical protein